VIAEAAACGLPCVARGAAIDEDVLPSSIGIRAPGDSVVESVRDLLADDALRRTMAASARKLAVENWGRASSLVPMLTMLDLLGEDAARRAAPTVLPVDIRRS
ncbi:MAG: hypothetical protein ACOCTG_02010, partial [Bacteroidota bacterium]